jgi:hypothetical protein
MKKMIPYNTDSEGNAKTILSGCYKFGVATLTRMGGATMTIVIVIEDESIRTRQKQKQ